MTPTDIAEELWRTRKIRVDRRKIDLDVIKRIGRYSIPVHVFEGVTAEVKTLVVPEGGELPPEEELAALEAAEQAEAEAAAAAHAEAVEATEAALAEEALAEEATRRVSRGRARRRSRPRPRASPRATDEKGPAGPSFVSTASVHTAHNPGRRGVDERTKSSQRAGAPREQFAARGGEPCPALGIAWEHVFCSPCTPRPRDRVVGTSGHVVP